jgi:LmbE family N-acetylglucosaminyl deacetylase
LVEAGDEVPPLTRREQKGLGLVPDAAIVTELPVSLGLTPLLIVSPHCDDAALSCAALLAREAPIDVLTVFAGQTEPLYVGTPDSPRQGSWDRVTGFSDSAMSAAARRDEDLAAFAGSSHRLTWLDLDDAQYLTDSRRRPEDVALVVDTILGWLSANTAGIVAVPACAGPHSGRVRDHLRLVDPLAPRRHPDHVLVRDAVLGSVGSHGDARVLLYEDLPYLWGKRAHAEVRRVQRRHGMRFDHLVLPVDRHAKVERIAKYVSQTPHLGMRGKRVDIAEDLAPTESYWLLR